MTGLQKTDINGLVSTTPALCSLMIDSSKIKSFESINFTILQ